MTFNHYAKIKRILDAEENWYVVRIDKPTSSKKFNGEEIFFDHYYRVFSATTNAPIPYCKFQQIERFARIMQVAIEEIPIITLSDTTA